MINRFTSKPTTKLSTTNKTKMITFRCPMDIAGLLPTSDRTEWLLDTVKEKIAKEVSEVSDADFQKSLAEALKHRSEISRKRREELTLLLKKDENGQ